VVIESGCCFCLPLKGHSWRRKRAKELSVLATGYWVAALKIMPLNLIGL